MSSTGQIVGGIVGAVIGYVVTGFNPYGALQSTSVPGQPGNFLASNCDENSSRQDKQEVTS